MLHFIRLNLTLGHEKKDNAMYPCATLEKCLTKAMLISMLQTQTES